MSARHTLMFELHKGAAGVVVVAAAPILLNEVSLSLEVVGRRPDERAPPGLSHPALGGRHALSLGALMHIVSISGAGWCQLDISADKNDWELANQPAPERKIGPVGTL